MTEWYAAQPAPPVPAGGHGARTGHRSGWVVFGAGGHARAVVDVLERLGESVVAVVGDPDGWEWPVEVIADDDEGVARVRAGHHLAAVGIGSARLRLQVLARLTESTNPSIEGAIPTIESTRGRGETALSIEESALSIGAVAPPVVASTATVARDAALGPGTVVLEHAHVGPGSTVGRGTIVNTAGVVEHDCTVGDGVHLAPGAILLGGAVVGSRTLVGSGAQVLPRVTVGIDATVGAGAVVNSDVQDGQTVAGVPARPRSGSGSTSEGAS